MQILAERGYVVKERGIISVKGKGQMLTFYVIGRKISRSWRFGKTVNQVKKFQKQFFFVKIPNFFTIFGRIFFKFSEFTLQKNFAGEQQPRRSRLWHG